MQNELPVRKNIRLKDYDYSQEGCYFLTICVEDRYEMLSKVYVGDGVLDVPIVQLSEYGVIAEKHINAINEHYEHISIQKYVIMPNHIHILLFILNNPIKNNGIIKNDNIIQDNGIIKNDKIIQNNGTIKNNEIIQNNGTSRTPSPTNAVIPSFVSTFKRFVHKDCGFTLFQRAYHDRIIRDETEYFAKWKYIEENPMKWAEDEYYKKN